MGAMNPCGGGVVWTSTGLILVLYILLVIVTRGFWF
ncbi:YjcZ family sporulation protein [Gorillibacterium sp. sgz5001074]